MAATRSPFVSWRRWSACVRLVSSRLCVRTAVPTAASLMSPPHSPPPPQHLHHPNRPKPQPNQVYGYALYKNGRYACIKYPTEGYDVGMAGRSFHHGRFVQQLRLAASAMPGVTAREGTVRRLLNGAAAERAGGVGWGGVGSLVSGADCTGGRACKALVTAPPPMLQHWLVQEVSRLQPRPKPHPTPGP